MQITDIRIRLTPNEGQRLKAYCTLTFDNEFVVKDVKIIDGNSGLFVAMPSRKLSDHCGRCGTANHLLAHFCSECGTKLAENRVLRDPQGKPKLNIDIAHPIDSACRARFEERIIEAYNKEFQATGATDYAAGSQDDRAAESESPEQ